MKIVNTYVPSVPKFGVHERVQANLMIVLTQDETGLFAAYMGIVSLGHEQPEEEYHRQRARRADQVAGTGTKLNWRQAVGFFPSISQAQYRA